MAPYWHWNLWSLRLQNGEEFNSEVQLLHHSCYAENLDFAVLARQNEVNKVLRLYLTIPVMTTTSKTSFSVLKSLLTYLRATMTEN